MTNIVISQNRNLKWTWLLTALFLQEKEISYPIVDKVIIIASTSDMSSVQLSHTAELQQQLYSSCTPTSVKILVARILTVELQWCKRNGINCSRKRPQLASCCFYPYCTPIRLNGKQEEHTSGNLWTSGSLQLQLMPLYLCWHNQAIGFKPISELQSWEVPYGSYSPCQGDTFRK